MLNAEKYKDRILEVASDGHDFSIDKRNYEIKPCREIECSECLFESFEECSCCCNTTKWLLSEYKEPVKLTRFEYFILDWLLNSQCVRYIARDRNGNLYAHINKPCRVKYEWRGNVSAVDLTIFGELFAFVKWQNTEPTPIKDVLDNCEVVESDL